MDREISKEEIKKRRNKKIIRAGAIVLIIFTCFIIVEKWLGQSVNRADLTFSTVDRGTIEVSVNASGKVVPIFEEIINSPINSRIIETYKKSGDAVDAGTPILKLDLQSAETDYQKGQDDEQMRISKLQQLKVDQNTKLTDLAMQIRVAQMKLNRMRVEMHSEKYLDSIGASTRDNVHQMEMKDKIAMFCDVQPEAVIENRTAATIYEVPLMMQKEGLDKIALQKLNMDFGPADMSDWEKMVYKINNPKKKIKVAVVGKYVELPDAYISVTEALHHGGIDNEAAVKIHWVNAEEIEDPDVDLDEVFVGCKGILVQLS